MFLLNLYFFLVFIEYFILLNNSKSLIFFYIFFIIIYYASSILFYYNNLNYNTILNHFSFYNSYIKNNLNYFFYMKSKTDLLYFTYKLISFYFDKLYLKINKIVKLTMTYFIINVLTIKRKLLLYKTNVLLPKKHVL